MLDHYERLADEKKNIQTIRRLCAELVKLGGEKALAGSQEYPDEIENHVRKRVSDIKLKLIDFVVVIPKSDDEILEEVNVIAQIMAKSRGYVMSNPKQLMFSIRNPQADMYWTMAVLAYEHMTGTEVADAVSGFEEKHGE